MFVICKGEYRFECGKCDAEWPYDEVCKMALLTPEEMEYFEKKMFSNAKACFDVKSVSITITLLHTHKLHQFL